MVYQGYQLLRIIISSSTLINITATNVVVQSMTMDMIRFVVLYFAPMFCEIKIAQIYGYQLKVNFSSLKALNIKPHCCYCYQLLYFVSSQFI